MNIEDFFNRWSVNLLPYFFILSIIGVYATYKYFLSLDLGTAGGAAAMALIFGYFFFHAVTLIITIFLVIIELNPKFRIKKLFFTNIFKNIFYRIFVILVGLVQTILMIYSFGLVIKIIS